MPAPNNFVRLAVQGDGNLCVYNNKTGGCIWNSNTDGKG